MYCFYFIHFAVFYLPLLLPSLLTLYHIALSLDLDPTYHTSNIATFSCTVRGIVHARSTQPVIPSPNGLRQTRITRKQRYRARMFGMFQHSPSYSHPQRKKKTNEQRLECTFTIPSPAVFSVDVGSSMTPRLTRKEFIRTLANPASGKKTRRPRYDLAHS